MQPYLRSLVAAALLAVALPATAGTTVDLSIAGTFAPGACDLALSSNSINIGTFPASSLSQTGNTSIGPFNVPMSIICDAPTRFALRAIDQRQASGNGANGFGLGLTPAGEKIGLVIPHLRDGSAASGALVTVQSSNSGAAWSSRTDQLTPFNVLGFQRASDAISSGPIPLDQLTAAINISGTINRADRLTLTEAVLIDGLLTLELIYL